jgi:hypothetical protein
MVSVGASDDRSTLPFPGVSNQRICPGREQPFRRSDQRSGIARRAAGFGRVARAGR